jgi:hypothetical protein
MHILIGTGRKKRAPKDVSNPPPIAIYLYFCIVSAIIEKARRSYIRIYGIMSGLEKISPAQTASVKK